MIKTKQSNNKMISQKITIEYKNRCLFICKKQEMRILESRQTRNDYLMLRIFVIFSEVSFCDSFFFSSRRCTFCNFYVCFWVFVYVYRVCNASVYFHSMRELFVSNRLSNC